MAIVRHSEGSIWRLTGTPEQQAIAADAFDRCDFPFERLGPSLAAEGKTRIEVAWEDLSRYAAARSSGDDGGHSHIHIGDAVAHPIERTIDGRRRVLGLFYLPPYTRVVIDASLSTSDPELAKEVVLAEGAHAADYHSLKPGDRWAITNILHDEDLPLDADVSDGAAFNLDGHTCSWFDVGPYAMWVGEAFMEAFVESFAPTVQSTMSLAHPTNRLQAAQIRGLLLGVQTDNPEPPSELELELVRAMTDLKAQMNRFTTTTGCPKYVRESWTRTEDVWLRVEASL